jgi:hypothetical protein
VERTIFIDGTLGLYPTSFGPCGVYPLSSVVVDPSTPGTVSQTFSTSVNPAGLVRPGEDWQALAGVVVRDSGDSWVVGSCMAAHDLGVVRVVDSCSCHSHKGECCSV